MTKGRGKNRRAAASASTRVRFGVPVGEIGVVHDAQYAEMLAGRAILMNAVWSGALEHARVATLKDAICDLIVDAWGNGDTTMSAEQALTAANEIRMDLLDRFDLSREYPR